jgi:hypothetical protein
MTRVAFVASAIVLWFAACVENSIDAASDSEAEGADAQGDQAEAASVVVGLYQTTSTAHEDGDIEVLQLDAFGAHSTKPTDLDYVRSRCYRRDCSLVVAESDTYDIYRSTEGKTYVRFWSETLDNDGSNGWSVTPKLADVYEIKSTSTGIELRKSTTSHWLPLDSATPATQCTRGGGTWASDSCTCPGNVPNEATRVTFAPGAGGCVANPQDNESKCGDSDGMWTDDDESATGTYCLCGIGRYDDANGTCETI